MNRPLLVVFVVVLVALAGCAGVAPGDDGTDAESEAPAESNASDDAESDTESNGANGTEDDSAPSNGSDRAAPDGELEIHHFDVGQADSALLVTPDGETVLVDSGDWRDDGETVLAELEELGVDRIDHLVATHGHADHIGGHAAVIEHFEEEGDGIGAVYDSGVAHTSQTYENYIEAVEDYDLTFYAVEAGEEIPTESEGLEVTVLNPPAGDSGSDLHYNSVALAIEFGEFRYLTTGDAEVDAEERMVDDHADTLDADAYQAGHHGSSTSSTEPFLDAVDPEIAVISSGYESQYGHPHDEVLEAFADRSVETYWTGVHGTVVLSTDGESVAVETEYEGPTDALDLLAEKPADDEDAASRLAPPRDATALATPSIDAPAAPTTYP